jgi:magnesium transporter
MDPMEREVKISIIDYDESHIQEKDVKDVEECLSFRDSSTVTWINIDGITDRDLIGKVGECFGLHPLLVEDITTTTQRPKIEETETYIFIMLKMLYWSENAIKTEQVSIVLGPTFVLSFQEYPGDVFDPIRERINNAKGRIRRRGADYLSHGLMDAVVDNYFIVLEKIGEEVEEIEEELVTDPKPETLQDIYRLKRMMVELRRSVWPLREVISRFERIESSLVDESTKIYFRDIYEHTIQVIDTVETYRDMMASMIDLYLSSVSNKMNEVMKVLTIFASIFIPLTFIAGIYGMNFQYMPELGWHWGYFGVLGSMGFLITVMVIYFRRKGWL